MHVRTQHLVASVLIGSAVTLYIIYSSNYFSLGGVSDNYFADNTTCIMTSTSMGRFGNNLLEYATLYALARLNKCKAIVTPNMAAYVRSCFLITMETNATVDQLAPWQSFHLDYLMKDEYRRLSISHNDTYIKLTGYPSDWRFFADYNVQIRSEFVFSESIQILADNFLRSTRQGSENLTYIGVHVRRTDYIPYLARQGCEIAGPGYLRAAMTLMRSKYPDSIFIVASDDIKWCQEVLTDFNFRTVFVPQTFSPCATMAVLGHCNHSIVTQGTFGFWGAYLAHGDAVYYTNYCNNRTDVLHKFRGTHLNHWIPITASGDTSDPTFEE